jgi:hypothetical protein
MYNSLQGYGNLLTCIVKFWKHLPQDLARCVSACCLCVQATYYGQQSGQNDAGACSYGKNNANSLGLEWISGVNATIAINDAQFQDSGKPVHALVFFHVFPSFIIFFVPLSVFICWERTKVENAQWSPVVAEASQLEQIHRFPEMEDRM